MTKDKANQEHIITLTDERPVVVTNKAWPVVASASYDRDHNNQELSRRWYLRVRQHDTGSEIEGEETVLNPHIDGRCIVYGWYESSYQGEHGSQAGYRCHTDDLVETIRKVGERISADQWLVDSCIADIPAVEADGADGTESESVDAPAQAIRDAVDAWTAERAQCDDDKILDVDARHAARLAPTLAYLLALQHDLRKAPAEVRQRLAEACQIAAGEAVQNLRRIAADDAINLPVLTTSIRSERPLSAAVSRI